MRQVAEHAFRELRPWVALAAAHGRGQQRLLEPIPAVAVGVAPAGGLLLGRLRTGRVPRKGVAPHTHPAQAHVAGQVRRRVLQRAWLGVGVGVGVGVGARAGVGVGVGLAVR